jgi:hypothetical protein
MYTFRIVSLIYNGNSISKAIYFYFMKSTKAKRIVPFFDVVSASSTLITLDHQLLSCLQNLHSCNVLSAVQKKVITTWEDVQIIQWEKL